jgi:hypothetical protein
MISVTWPSGSGAADGDNRGGAGGAGGAVAAAATRAFSIRTLRSNRSALWACAAWDIERSEPIPSPRPRRLIAAKFRRLVLFANIKASREKSLVVIIVPGSIDNLHFRGIIPFHSFADRRIGAPAALSACEAVHKMQMINLPIK